MKKQTYAVVLYRADGHDKVLLESDNFDACMSKWQELRTEWTTSVAEKRPFVLKKPMVTAFDPSLVREICISVVPEIMKQSDNPYVSNMQAKGLTNMLGGASVLDGGYL